MAPRTPDGASEPGAAAPGCDQVRSEHGAGLDPADDVHALGVLGWRALTGRLPGPDSHRVPLTLMCPGAPRHLVLMLEAALCDDPVERPTAHELAAGFDAAAPAPRSVRRPARRPEDRMTPEVIRADGTVLHPRRLRRPVRPSRSPSHDLAGASSKQRAPVLTRGSRNQRDRATRSGVAGAIAAAAGTGSPRRWWLALAAVVVAAAVVWGTTRWMAPEDTMRAPAAAEASRTLPPGGDPSNDATDSSVTPTAGRTGTPRPGVDDRHPAPANGPSARGAKSPASQAPGATVQDRDREAQQAVRDLVAARAAALAAGDGAAVDAVYVPGSQLATRDRETIQRARAQDTGGTGFTAFSGIRMRVVELAEQKRTRDARVSPAEAARIRTYRAEVATQGWHGEVPAGSHVTQRADEAVQDLWISVVQTPEGWRLADVTPVTDGQ